VQQEELSHVTNAVSGLGIIPGYNDQMNALKYESASSFTPTPHFGQSSFSDERSSIAPQHFEQSSFSDERSSIAPQSSEGRSCTALMFTPDSSVERSRNGGIIWSQSSEGKSCAVLEFTTNSSLERSRNTGSIVPQSPEAKSSRVFDFTPETVKDRSRNTGSPNFSTPSQTHNVSTPECWIRELAWESTKGVVAEHDKFLSVNAPCSGQVDVFSLEVDGDEEESGDEEKDEVEDLKLKRPGGRSSDENEKKILVDFVKSVAGEGIGAIFGSANPKRETLKSIELNTSVPGAPAAGNQSSDKTDPDVDHNKSF